MAENCYEYGKLLCVMFDVFIKLGVVSSFENWMLSAKKMKIIE
jgi:hypothetical protein